MPRDDTPFQQHVAARCVSIRPSDIVGAGLGVFAATALPPHRILGYYRGEQLTLEQYDERYPHGALAAYVLQTGLTTFLDARDETHWTRFINDCRGSGMANNVEFTARGGVRTRRRILAGEELYVNYGPEYF